MMISNEERTLAIRRRNLRRYLCKAGCLLPTDIPTEAMVVLTKVLHKYKYNQPPEPEPVELPITPQYQPPTDQVAWMNQRMRFIDSLYDRSQEFGIESLTADEQKMLRLAGFKTPT